MPRQQNAETAMRLVDAALEDGFLVDGPDGLALADPDAVSKAIKEAREHKKAEGLDLDSDASTNIQEKIILGFTLQGDGDNAPRWARFRQALGLPPGQPVPMALFSDPTLSRIASEIDAAFSGQRDIRRINGWNLIDCYSRRCERGQITGSPSAFAMATRELTDEIGTFIENDFLIAIELLQSKTAREMLRKAASKLDYALRADRAVEMVVSDHGREIDEAKRLLKGRLGDDLEIKCLDDFHDVLVARMTAEKAPSISTNIDAFDMDIQGGVNPLDSGKMNVIGARTGVGKTTLGIAAACGLVLNGADVMFISVELSEVEITARANSHFAHKYGFRDCKAYILEGRGWDRNVPEGFEQLRQQMAADHQAGTIGQLQVAGLTYSTSEEIVDHIYSAKARNPRLSAVFVDHFHMIKSSSGFNNRSQEMENRALHLQQSCRAAHVDLFLMAQLNRNACMAAHPDLEHVNGTDAIAQLASAVWLLEFPKKEEGTPFDSRKLICHHAKFRNGQRDKTGKEISRKQSGLIIDRQHNRTTGEFPVDDQ